MEDVDSAQYNAKLTNFAVLITNSIKNMESLRNIYRVDRKNSQIQVKSEDRGRVKWVPICSLLYVKALTKSYEGEVSGFVLEWFDRYGKIKSHAFPLSALLNFDTLATVLSDGGIIELPRDTWSKSKFIKYLDKSRPNKWLRDTNRTGWHGENFVMPNSIISPNQIEHDLMYIPKESDDISIRGNLAQWRDNIGRYCVGNCVLITAVCAALASPILSLVNMDGFVLHLHGESTSGKTTIAKIFGSVLGIGIDNWHGSNVGLEAKAIKRNNIGLILDELGQCSNHILSELIYLFGNGVGKTRANRNGNEIPVRKFKLVLISTGESHHETYLKQNNLNSVTGGQSVRFLNARSDKFMFGCFENLHGYPDGASFSKKLVSNAKKFKGSLGIEFIQHLCNYIHNDSKFLELLSNRVEQNLAEFEVFSPQEKRKATCMCVIMVCGELAIEWGLLDWDIEQTKNAIKKFSANCMELVNKDGPSFEHTDIIKTLMEYLDYFRDSRFALLDENGAVCEQPNRDIDGYYEVLPEGIRYYIKTPALKKIVKNYDLKTVLEVLYREGLLYVSDKALSRGSYQYQKRIKGYIHDLKINVYNVLISYIGGF